MVLLDPRAKLLGDLDVSTARGLEIGPLHNPRVRKDEGDVRYLDHTSADGLRDKYATNAIAAPQAGNVVDVDYVWHPGQRLSEAVGSATFDYVVASHVLEHVPNPIGWLEQVVEVLAPDGLLALVLPDKRYCFDVNRGLTTMADLVEAYLRHLDVPSFRNIYDHEVHFLPVDAQELWAGANVAGERRRDVDDPDAFAFACCIEQASASGEYRDVHCHTFTPDSFVGLLATMCRLGLLAFRPYAFYPTEVGHNEFFVTLQRPARPVTREQQLATLDEWISKVASTTMAPPGDGGIDTRVSPSELRLIELKRGIMTRARRLLRRR